MKRGEVRWYGSSRPAKRRPVLLLARDSALEFLGEVTIAPVTSTIRAIPSEVVLTTEDGMPRDCAVNLDHVQTISRDNLGGVITALVASRKSVVRLALQLAL